MAFALAAALRRRIADAGFDEPLLLEPFERGVHRAHRHAAAAALFDLAAHRGSVGVGPETQQREHHHLFELTEDGRRHSSRSWRANIYNVDIFVNWHQPQALYASAYAREQSGELRRDHAGAAFGREGGPYALYAP